MNRGSPGGILLIAFGVLFLRLAYTGRIGAVWNALITGGTETGTGSGSGSGSGARPVVPSPCDSPECVKLVSPNGCGDKFVTCKKDVNDSQLWCCPPTDPAQIANSYTTYNAAGAPYTTSAGNVL